jgi:hypothetical protein
MDLFSNAFESISLDQFGSLGDLSSSSMIGGTAAGSNPNQNDARFSNPVDKKYSIDQLTYPEDLFSSRQIYGGNYVVFYVNVPEDSKLITEEKQETVNIGDSERFRARINQEGYGTGAAIAGSAAVGALGSTILGALGGGGSVASNPLVGGALGAGAAAVVSGQVGGKMSRQQKRLKTAIALHVPNQLTANYSMQWDAEDTGLFQVGAKLGEAGIKAVTDMSPKQLETAGGVVKSAVTGLALSAPGVGGALSAMSGLAYNPKKEQLFKGVDFRTFTFDYQFAPRSSSEAGNIMRIVEMFKLHMHPEFKDQDSFIYIYPSEFDIHYYHLTNENKAIFKHTSCVLTNLSVNYTPNANFATFADGSPTQINIQMTFKELAILTKAEIAKGY